MIDVLLVDDHAVVRAGYRRMLTAMPDIAVTEAEDCDSAVALVEQRRFDVYVLDLTLPGASGLELMRRLLSLHEDARILIFSMHEDVLFSTRALQSGARGYISKSSSPNVMVEAVRTIARGKYYVGQDVAQSIVIDKLATKSRGLDSLTDREFEIFTMLVAGRTLADISNDLALNYKTVANHQSSIRHKLGVENRLQLIRIAAEHGLQLPDSLVSSA